MSGVRNFRRTLMNLKSVWRGLIGSMFIGALLCFGAGCSDKCNSCHRAEKPCDSCSGGKVIESK